MELLILDKDLNSSAILDTFESLIWTDRYGKYGDFEIYTPINTSALAYIQEDYYLWLKDSEHVMIIEDLQITSDAENGNKLTVTGRSLESILSRRIIWKQTVLTGNLQNGIKKLLDENAISPTDPNRKISKLIFEPSTDPIITELTVEAQYNGDDLYEAVAALCEAANIGFKITLTDDNLFKFKLYAGTDRSYDQIANPFVVFSPKFDNLTNSNYVLSIASLKTVSLVAGEGEGSARKTATAEIVSGGGSDLDRREMFTDASGVSSTIDGGTLTEAEYTSQLVQKGMEDLAQNSYVRSFEGQADTTRTFKYGEDFFMGDIVQIANEYGMEAKSRVIEVVRSQSVNGIDVYPTFSKVE
jgi:hypothetical protein